MVDQLQTEREEEQDVFFGVINRFIGYFTRHAVPNSSNDITREYPFVAMDTRQAYEQIKIAREHLLARYGSGVRFSFLDIGCGIGNILLLAEMMDFAIYGIEKDLGSIDIARGLVGEEAIGQEDIWHFERLQEFDVVYYFRPFCKKNLQLQFEQKIEDTIKPGAILIANRKMSESIHSDQRFQQLSPDWPVWFRNQDV